MLLEKNSDFCLEYNPVFIYINTQQYGGKTLEKMSLAPVYDTCTSLSFFSEEINSHRSCNGLKNEWKKWKWEINIRIRGGRAELFRNKCSRHLENSLKINFRRYSFGNSADLLLMTSSLGDFQALLRNSFTLLTTKCSPS